MNLILEMQKKHAFMAKGLHLRKRDTPTSKPKDPYLAQFKIRSETVEGGEIPSDEVQLDFIISSARRDGHNSYMTEKPLRTTQRMQPAAFRSCSITLRIWKSRLDDDCRKL